MRMVSSYRFPRIEDYEPMHMVAASLFSDIEGCETMRMVSSQRSSRIDDYATMRMVSPYLFVVALGLICAENPARARTRDRTWLEIAP